MDDKITFNLAMILPSIIAIVLSWNDFMALRFLVIFYVIGFMFMSNWFLCYIRKPKQKRSGVKK